MANGRAEQRQRQQQQQQQQRQSERFRFIWRIWQSQTLITTRETVERCSMNFVREHPLRLRYQRIVHSFIVFRFLFGVCALWSAADQAGEGHGNKRFFVCVAINRFPIVSLLFLFRFQLIFHIRNYRKLCKYSIYFYSTRMFETKTNRRNHKIWNDQITLIMSRFEWIAIVVT